MKRIHLETVDSTNLYLRNLPDDEGGASCVVTATFQTAGKGHGTNTWESAPGKNLLFSMRVYPKDVEMKKSFLLSMVHALAIYDTLSTYAEGFSIKWPNDIYWHDYKISGTLIETSAKGNFVRKCIFGTGIDVNQRVFMSDAPNPISLSTILGHDVDLDEVLAILVEKMESNLQLLDSEKVLCERYHQLLYRSKGFYSYRDDQGLFEAEIYKVEPNGHLWLRTKRGELREYAFKEVAFVIK